ncbi:MULTISPECIES: response regulator transcription factor [Leuconostoc]|jgi:two-component system, OmpR family, response regulator|uniref:response regulator transcription factor n=1 Tax=Leuconostoc TaxID=1243 RepID=UPI0011DCC676|nr:MULTISPECIES: response regulator transcription factor [Leuconostoc]MBK0040042.1 response regulator transcription factor [Leuconostoc sp. S51]MBK0051000.1 response regulator transcription factor [Leuconostoc sp. S50]MCT4414158.1 DNA-binding response regulator [Leuconostoc pseudomesenteroides]
MISILVVEDDQDLNQTVCSVLKRHGYSVSGASSANEAFSLMFDNKFDLVISDIMMPKVDGFELAETIRQLDHNMPIMFMTARGDLESKQIGFRIGIDDYMVKPIDFDEMLLRVGALLRRAKIEANKRLTIGKFVMDADEHVAYNGNESIAFTMREFELVFKLLSFPKKTFTRGQLMDDFWGIDTNTSTRTVDVYMTKIRDKLADVNDFEIVTVRGLGYKAVPNES